MVIVKVSACARHLCVADQRGANFDVLSCFANEFVAADMSLGGAPFDGRWQRSVNRAPGHLGRGEIERIVGLPIENEDNFRTVSGLSTLDVPGDECLIFRDRFDECDLAAISAFEGRSALFLLPVAYRERVRVPAIFLNVPRDAFIPLVEKLYDYLGLCWQGFESGPIAQKKRPGTMVMQGCFVHPSAEIGAGTTIFPGSFIGPRVAIGRNTIIKPNCVIGSWGFGIHISAEGRNVHLPHVGGVVIGDDVEIGAASTVCSGTIHATLVKDGVKTDDRVHIAHNVVLGRGSQLAAHAELSGSVIVGERSYLGPRCSVASGVTIGDHSAIAIGSVVLRDVPDGAQVAGSPARVRANNA